MSRAFVKEPDGDQVADDLPDLPVSPHPNYVTPSGLAALRERQQRLAGERQSLVEDDDPAKRLRLRQVERDLRYLRTRIESAIPVDPARRPNSRPAGEVGFGAIVTVEDEDGERLGFAIVGEDEADARAGKVSWISPLAEALEGARVGDLVTWRRPAGDLELEVIAIRYEDA